MRANALENLMLSAVSFDEFEHFAARLAALAREMPILIGLPPVIYKIRDSGGSWSTALFQMAMTNYNRNNPAQDHARYGVAKSTYNILLKTRKQLRLSRADWRTAVHEHSALGLRMAAECQVLRGGDQDVHSPEEFLPILTDTIWHLDDYLAVTPGDSDLQNVRDAARSFISETRARWAALRIRSLEL